MIKKSADVDEVIKKAERKNAISMMLFCSKTFDNIKDSVISACVMAKQNNIPTSVIKTSI